MLELGGKALESALEIDLRANDVPKYNPAGLAVLSDNTGRDSRS